MPQSRQHSGMRLLPAWRETVDGVRAGNPQTGNTQTGTAQKSTGMIRPASGRGSLRIAGLLCVAMLLGACGPPISDEALIVEPTQISSDGMNALTLGQPELGRLFAGIGCPAPGKPLRVFTVHQTAAPFALDSDAITIDEQTFPLRVHVAVDGEEYVVDESETVVDLVDDDPDPDMQFSEITIYADTSGNELLEAMMDAEWIEVAALGDRWAAQFPREMVAAMQSSCEKTRTQPPFAQSPPSGGTAPQAMNGVAPAESTQPDDTVRSIAGPWQGRYFEGEGYMDFRMSLHGEASGFSGDSFEPNTWITGGPAQIRASIEGGINGDRVQFTKIYEPVARIDETIVYEGTINPGGTEIQGRWRMVGRSGAFHMWRD